MAILVDPALADAIRTGLRQFEIDLCNDGLAVIENRSAFATPPELRSYLADLHARTEQHLVGAILIGDLPHAYQWVTAASFNPRFPPFSEEAISFQYYADLDGSFETSPGYSSPAGQAYSYDVHGGDVDWEIWIGLLPVYQGNLASTVEALDRYFAKNHDFRSRAHSLPRAFLEVNEHYSATTADEHDFLLTLLRSGEYAWTPFSSAPDARLYFDSLPGGLSVDQGYADLSAGVADFTVLDSHGFWGASGKIDISWVETNPVATTFLWSNGCAVGNLDYPENFLTSALYSPTSAVLVAKGTTNNSGGMGNNQNGFFGRNIATALSDGETFGGSILSHVNVPLVHPWSASREFHLATAVVLGDPTLPLSPAEVAFDIDIRPGDASNQINIRRRLVAVAVLGSPGFRATSVDPLSARFGPDGARARGEGDVVDVDADGDLDLLLSFRLRDTGIRCGDVSARLSAEALGGLPIERWGPIRVTGCRTR